MAKLKEIRVVDKEKGIVQITTPDERWYTFGTNDPENGLPIYRYIPSITWITSFVPKGVEFYKWLASKGWNEAEAIKSEAGDKGTRVHNAIEQFIETGEFDMETKIAVNGSDEGKELDIDEYTALVSFRNWFNSLKDIEIILKESYVISEDNNFAGTVDLICRINGEIWIIDFKTSQYIWDSMLAQVSAYKKGLVEMCSKSVIDKIEGIENARLAILQVGYKGEKRNAKNMKPKKFYKFTEIQDAYDTLFVPAKSFWWNKSKNTQPAQRELPIHLSLNIKNKQNGNENEGPSESNIGGDTTNQEFGRTPNSGAVQEVLLHSGPSESQQITGSDEVPGTRLDNQTKTDIQPTKSRPKLPKR